MKWEIDRRWLYTALIVLCSIGLFIKFPIKVTVDNQTADLYAKLWSVDPNKPVLIESDWSISTRGENMAHLESLVRILMARNIKFAYFTETDAPSRAVSDEVVKRILAEENPLRVKNGLAPYKFNDDAVSVGLFPNAEGASTAMGEDLLKAWSGKQAKQEGGGSADIFSTAALKNVHSLKDVSMMVVITSTSTSDIVVQRLNDKVNLYLMCTGVVGGTSLQYYPGQYKGIASGLKAGYEMEYMMAKGINHPGPDGTIDVPVEKIPGDVPPVPSYVKSLDRANTYYLTLHIALILMIVLVILGNIATVLNKKKGEAA